MLKDTLTKKIPGELTEGKHNAILTKWDYMAHQTNPDYDYIKAQFTVDGNKPYTRNLFEKDVIIMSTQVRRQFGQQNTDIAPNLFFDTLIAEAKPFDIWISYPIVATNNGMRRKQNICYIEPIPTHGPDSEDNEKSEIPPGI